MEQYSRQIKRITWLSFSVNSGLSLLKCLIGFFGHSHALLADGFHSLSDVLIDLLVLFTARFAYQDADHNHPYGHGRIETVMTMGLALIVILAGVGIFLGVAWHAWTNHSAFIAPSAITLWVAGLSVLVNESLFRYMKHVSERLQSKLLNVSAWHNRSDAASSLLVFISVILSIAGYRFVDVLAAAIIALFIIKMGWQFAWTSLQELVDTGLDESQLKQMEAKITEVSGVKSLHQLRTRSIGGDVFLDVHILVDAFISVSEGHFIGDQVMQALRKQFTFVKDVTVHVDPEDDLHHHRSSTLPNRQSLKPLINTACAGLPGAEHLSWRLHYLQGHIEIELLLPAEVIQDNVADIQAQYQQALSNITAIKTVHILLNIPGALT